MKGQEPEMGDAVASSWDYTCSNLPLTFHISPGSMLRPFTIENAINTITSFSRRHKYRPIDLGMCEAIDKALLSKPHNL